MRKSALIATILALILLSSCGNHTTEEVEIGYLGEARFDPFLAASQLLERRGYTVERKRSRSQLPDYQTVLVVPAESIENLADAKRYRRWIEEGGHVIYLTSGYGMHAWKEYANQWKIGQQMELAHPLLEQFNIGIETTEPSGEDVKIELEQEEIEQEEIEEKFITYIEKNYEQGEVELYSRPLEVQMRSAQRLDASESEWDPDVVLGQADKAQMLSIPIQYGRLSIMTSAYPIRNRYIGELDHGVMLAELLQTHNDYAVHFLHGGGTTFLGMLLEYGWMPLLGLALLCALWIWKHLPRFGPAIPHVDVADRQFTEHIEMTGQFLWKNKASSALLSPVVSQIRRGLQRRHPHFAEDLDGAIEYFVENTDLPKDEIAEALSGIPIEDPASMTRVVQNLKTLTESL